MHADERMAFGRAVFQIRMALIIHVMEEAHCLPQVRVSVM
jgi:hypothetical protein